MSTPEPVAVAKAFLAALADRDLATAGSYLDDDVTVEGPRARLRGAVQVLEAIRQFAETVTGVRVIAALGDDTQAMVLYDVETGSTGTLRVADHFVVRDGRITANLAVFAEIEDPRPV